MKDVQGSNVFSDVRMGGAATWSAASFLAFVLMCPAISHAATLWQSASSSADSLQLLDPTAAHRWFETNDNPSILLGTWNSADFTPDASTTLHFYVQWNGTADPVLDLDLNATVGGDPFYGTGSTTANLVGPAGDYYRARPSATSSLVEYVVPVTAGQTIHQGDQLWAYVYPSYGAYGADFWLGASGALPYFELCEGDCAAVPVAPACASECDSSVLFLPGIESSRLYDTDGGETRLWEPEGDALAQNLALDSTGKSIRSDIYTRDVVDTAYGIYGMYDAFIKSMDALKSNGAINDWAAVPYDWRLSLDQILSGGVENGQNIFYAAATDSPYIIQELKQLAATSKTGKVTIVAHSNGGLVAKALTQKLGADASQYIDKIIFVAVPQLGTPEAIGALLNGYDQEIVLWPSAGFIPGVEKISGSEMRLLGGNSPGAYNLLPSAGYFSTETNPVATFSSSTAPDWALRYGPSITTEDALIYFLADQNHRPVPLPSDTDEPAILNANLLAQAESVHADLDAWTPPPGVQLIQIAGWGVPTTLSSIEYGREANGSTTIEIPHFTIDGDGEVTVPSAMGTSTTTDATNYWLDLSAVNDAGFLTKHIPALAAVIGKNHGNILTVPQLNSFISDIITNSQQPLSAYQYLSTTSPIADTNMRRLEYALHSPLSLDLYDDQGRHTGVSTSTGIIEDQIPGTYYAEFGGVKYIFADEDSSQTINMTGYATGTFTLNISELHGDNTIIASTTFADIPTSPQTTATIGVLNDLSSLSDLTVEDSSSSISITPIFNGVATFGSTESASMVTSPKSQDSSPTVAPAVNGVPTPASSLVVKFATSSARIPMVGSSSSSTILILSATSSRVIDAAGQVLIISFASFITKGIHINLGITKLLHDGIARIVSAFIYYHMPDGTVYYY